MDIDPYRIVKKRNKSKIIFIFVIWIIAFFLIFLLVWHDTWFMMLVIIIAFFWPITYLFWALHFRTVYEKLVSQGKEEVFIKKEIMKERVRLGNYVAAIFSIILGLFISILWYGAVDSSEGRFMFILGLVYVIVAILILIFRKAVYNFSIKFERNKTALALLQSASLSLLASAPILAVGFALKIYIVSIIITGSMIVVAVTQVILAWRIIKRMDLNSRIE